MTLGNLDLPQLVLSSRLGIAQPAIEVLLVQRIHFARHHISARVPQVECRAACQKALSSPPQPTNC